MPTMHTISDGIEIMTGNETDEVNEEHFDFHLQRYQKKIRTINERK